jgi:hypothetical protein
VWTFGHHPTLKLPPPQLTNTGVLDPPPPTPTRQLTKIISASACTLANGFTYNGPGVTATFGAALPTPGDYVINPNIPGSNFGQQIYTPLTVLLFCDARLPADAVAFDYAELEYFAADETGNAAPTLAAFLDTRAPSINGFAYDQTIPIASCTGPMSPLYSGINPVSLCDTDGGIAFDGGAGLPLVWPGGGWTLFSLHFLISLPPSPDPTLPNLVYRVIVFYEAP